MKQDKWFEFALIAIGIVIFSSYFCFIAFAISKAIKTTQQSQLQSQTQLPCEGK